MFFEREFHSWLQKMVSRVIEVILGTITVGGRRFKGFCNPWNEFRFSCDSSMNQLLYMNWLFGIEERDYHYSGFLKSLAILHTVSATFKLVPLNNLRFRNRLSSLKTGRITFNFNSVPDFSNSKQNLLGFFTY